MDGWVELALLYRTSTDMIWNGDSPVRFADSHHRAMGDGRWETGDGRSRWEMGGGKWKNTVVDGRWEIGDDANENEEDAD